MDLQLRGKVVGITGGATGIGRACALSYLQEGCKLAVCGRTRSKLDAFAAECSAMGYTDALCHVADVADPAQLEGFVSAVVRRFGRLDIWYNNAGVGVLKPFLEISLEEWDMVMDINLRATFVGSKLVARQMMSQGGGGVIVNAASFTSVIPVAGHGPYSVSKWGINGFTRVLAAELASHNIRVFSFIPGMIETDINRSRVALNREYYAKQVAMNRVGDPDDLAPTLVMLTSDRASYFTGGCVEISGGKFCVQNPHYSWDMKHKI